MQFWEVASVMLYYIFIMILLYVVMRVRAGDIVNGHVNVVVRVR